MRLLVLKFGGAAVATPASFAHIAALVQQRRTECDGLVVVVSAMQGTTDQLISLARTVHPNPPQREYDMLITVGERISCSLLAMALAAQGCPAESFTGSQAGVITCSHHAEAKIVDVRPERILKTLARQVIPVIAGFQGVSRQGAITSLGRGGSDTTAVAFGIALQAERVEFYKDVPGVYCSDPKENNTAQHHPHLSYSRAKAIITQSEHRVLHLRCLDLAESNALPLYIRSFLSADNVMQQSIIAPDPLPIPRPQPHYESSSAE